MAIATGVRTVQRTEKNQVRETHLAPQRTTATAIVLVVHLLRPKVVATVQITPRTASTAAKGDIIPGIAQTGREYSRPK